MAKTWSYQPTLIRHWVFKRGQFENPLWIMSYHGYAWILPQCVSSPSCQLKVSLHPSTPIIFTSVRMLDVGQDYRCQCWTLKGADPESLRSNGMHLACSIETLGHRLKTGIEPLNHEKPGFTEIHLENLVRDMNRTIIFGFLWDWGYPMFRQLRSNFIRNHIRCILCILYAYVYT